MTYEEAKQIAITFFKAEENRVCNLGMYQEAEEYEEALEIIKEAVEKQIPNKPNEVLGLNGKEFCCPYCNEEIELIPWDKDETAYCLHCGQALDWSDGE